jgi:hypothetical protein
MHKALFFLQEPIPFLSVGSFGSDRVSLGSYQKLRPMTLKPLHSQTFNRATQLRSLTGEDTATERSVDI